MSELDKPTSNETHWEPHYHFFKPGKWINDPNGLIYLNGVFHLYFQMNPDDIVWGNMHWGHASSADLTSWQHHKIAIYAEPEGLGYVFSGGAVVDHHDTAGFSDVNGPAIVATFTHHSRDELQCQSIAYSRDGGHSFTPYENNPVIANPGLKDFRDPKVVWDELRSIWLKVVVAGQKVHFYQSINLKDWCKCSEFGEGKGAQQGVWECPDFFPMTCQQSGTTRWVLLISVNPGGPAGGSGMQYFVGDFDGETFEPDHDQIRWLDYGPDCYAGITWDNTPDIEHQRTLIGWMSNWQYANETPTRSWRGAMTLPRQVTLSETLNIQPAPLVKQAFDACEEILLNTTSATLPLSYKLDLTFEAHSARANGRLCWHYDATDYVSVVICFTARELVITRHFISAPEGFNQTFTVPFPDRVTHTLELCIFGDSCSLEFFLMDGLGVATTLIFPKTSESALTFEAKQDVEATATISQFKRIDTQ